ncbi:MAG: type II secretion system F family protein, partial [Acidothermaceae bacterium]
AARRASARRRAQALRREVVELAHAVAGELRSGRPASVAFGVGIESAGDPLRMLMAPVAELTRRGDLIDVCDAIDAVVARVPASVRESVEGLRRLAACLRVASSSGATLAPTVDRVADALQDEIELDRALAGSLAAPRATVRLLAALPVLGLLLGAAIGADPLRFLVGSGSGLGCTLVALSFDVAGVAWARRIARRAARIG